MRGKNAAFLLVGAFVVALALLSAGGLLIDRETLAEAAEDPIFVGAGDIARCEGKGDEATAALLDDIEGTVFTLGDNVQGYGTAAEFRGCYDPSWGRHESRTMPAVGNHDYETPGAGPYYDYFGSAAGEPDKGYYSYDLGEWHIVVLNSNCSDVKGGCGPGSEQERWLRADLAANPSTCTAAIFHQPRFSSGINGEAQTMGPFWEVLYDAGADVVLSGHNHSYERFAPQTPDRVADAKRGIRQFVVGTGGGILRGFLGTRPNSEVQVADTYGVLKMTLHPESYGWQFITAPAGEVADSGNASCSGATSPPPSDNTPPTVEPPQQTLTSDLTPGQSSVPVRLEWSAQDDDGVADYRLQQSMDGGTFKDVATSEGGPASKSLQLEPGANYQFRVRAVDRAGNASGWATGPSFRLDAQQENSNAVTYSSTWPEQVASGYYGGTRVYADDGGSTATFRFRGSSVSWLSSLGLNRGLAEVRIDGNLVETVDLHAHTWQPRVVVFTEDGLAPSVSHTLEIKVLGTKDATSSGTRAHVDGFATLQQAGP